MNPNQRAGSGPGPIHNLLGDVTIDRQGGSVTVKMRFPRRGLSVMLLLIAASGLVGLVATVGMVSGDRHKPAAGELGFFLTLGIAATFGGGLGGLYMLTRWRKVHLDHSAVQVKKGWCFWRSSRRTELSEYRGLHRFTKTMGAMDAGSAGLSVLGVAAAVATGHGMVAGKTIAFHFLELAHARDRLRNVTLTGSEDPYAVAALAEILAETFDLPLLTASMGGYKARATRGPATLGERLAEHAPPPWASGAESTDEEESTPAPAPAAEPRPLSPPPPTIDVQTQGDMTRILLPPSSKPMIAGVVMGILSGGAGTAIICAIPDAERWLGLILVAIGASMLPVGIINSRKRTTVILDRRGVCQPSAARGLPPLAVLWNVIQDVSVARSQTKKPGVLIVSDGPETWIGIGLKREELDWLCYAIRAHAARTASSKRATT